MCSSLLISRNETIANALDCVNPLVPNFGAQPVHLLPQDVSVCAVAVAPHLPDQRIGEQHLPAVVHERIQQRELQLCQAPRGLAG